MLQEPGSAVADPTSAPLLQALAKLRAAAPPHLSHFLAQAELRWGSWGVTNCSPFTFFFLMQYHQPGKRRQILTWHPCRRRSFCVWQKHTEPTTDTKIFHELACTVNNYVRLWGSLFITRALSSQSAVRQMGNNSNESRQAEPVFKPKTHPSLLNPTNPRGYIRSYVIAVILGP